MRWSDNVKYLYAKALISTVVDMTNDWSESPLCQGFNFYCCRCTPVGCWFGLYAKALISTVVDTAEAAARRELYAKALISTVVDFPASSSSPSLCQGFNFYCCRWCFWFEFWRLYAKALISTVVDVTQLTIMVYSMPRL